VAYVWYTVLEPDECRQRLLTRLSREKSCIASSLNRKDQKLSGGFTFSLRKINDYNNAFAPRFYGTVRPHKNGSIVTGRFRMHLLARAFSLISIFLPTILFGVPTLLWLLNKPPGADAVSNLFSGFTCSVLIALLCSAPVWYGRYYIGSADEQYLIDFLRNTFEY
jgi:hypothetical protein